MRLIGLILLSCLSVFTQAVVVSDLYEVRVEVADQSESSRTDALNEAIQQVLVKVSGNPETLQNETIQESSSQPNHYVRSYSYNNNPVNNQLELKVQFAQNLIDSLLRQTDQPIWGRSRPLILVWQAVEENNNRFIINPDQATWHYEFERAMNERGVPVIWPSLDLEDQLALPIANLWGLFRDDINNASERYLTDAYMAGRLVKVNDGWRYTGFFHNAQLPLSLEAQDEDIEVVLRSITNQVANYLAHRYAIQSNTENSGQHIDVANINGFQQYQDLLNYLQANSAIKNIKVRAINQQQVSLELTLSTGWEQVWDTLALDHRLMATEQPQTYQWQQ